MTVGAEYTGLIEQTSLDRGACDRVRKLLCFRLAPVGVAQTLTGKVDVNNSL